MYEENGDGGSAPVSIPSYPVRHSGSVIIAGSADCLFSDLEEANDLFPNADVIAVNKASQCLECRHVVTVYRDLVTGYKRGRVGFAQHAKYHCFRTCAGRPFSDYPDVDYWWPTINTAGSSGWAAAKVALVIGYEQVVLCGIPIEDMPHFDGEYLPEWGNEYHLEQTRKAIAECEWMHPFVSSMSGWTREFLGGPDERKR